MSHKIYKHMREIFRRLLLDMIHML